MPDVPTLINLRLQCNLPPLVQIPISVLSMFIFANCFNDIYAIPSLVYFLLPFHYSLYLALNFWFSITFHFSK